jgi:NAD(P)-dependent dehydrogenase (short-subunit alcohol dehydrogenase family)
MRLDGKVAVVTGGGQGIGRATAKAFADEGAKVVIAARTPSKLEHVKSEILARGGDVLAVPTDVGQAADITRLIEATNDRFGRLDVLVNNAGIGRRAPVDDVDMADYDLQMNTNLKGMYLGVRAGVPLMKAVGSGSIINVASVHGVNGEPTASIYAATKGGMLAGTRSMAAELAPHNIRVNAISPGAIWLESYEEAQLEQIAEDARDSFKNIFSDEMKVGHKHAQPIQCVGMPVAIALCAVYLASDESRFLTGQNIVVDGGLTTYLSLYGMDGARDAKEASEKKIRSWVDDHRKPNQE